MVEVNCDARAGRCFTCRKDGGGLQMIRARHTAPPSRIDSGRGETRKRERERETERSRKRKREMLQTSQVLYFQLTDDRIDNKSDDDCEVKSHH